MNPVIDVRTIPLARPEGGIRMIDTATTDNPGQRNLLISYRQRMLSGR
jgi:hypothetical protein